MPPVKPIPTLLETCLKYYGRHCVMSLRGLVSQCIDCDKDEKVSVAKRDSLLSSARAYFLEYTVVRTRKELLKVVFDEILDLDSEKQLEILRDCMIIHGGEWIEELDLTCDKLNSVVPIGVNHPEHILSQTVFQNYSWSKSLVSLTVTSLQNLQIIKAVGCHCQNIQYLDIATGFYGDPQYDSQMGEGCTSYLRYLYGAVENVNAGCPKLKTVVFPQFKGHPEVIDNVVKMIQFMPDLHVIRNVDTRLVAIKYTNAIGKLCTLKLTEYEEWDKESCRGGEYDVVNEAIGRIFPNVKRYASLCWNHGGLPSYLDQGLTKIQANFSCLQVIELYKYHTDLVEDLDFLDPMPSMKIFIMSESDDLVGVDKIRALGTAFPNLEKLVLYSNCYCVESDDVLQEDTFFPKLNTLELYRIAEIDVRFLQIMLEKCPSLRTLELFCSEEVYFYQEALPVTDEFLQNLSVSMENLEKVIIALDSESYSTSFARLSKFKLTYTSVQCILSACPNLRCLGDLGNWSVVEEELSVLIDSVAKNNWDLDLVYNSPC